jgi:hypothetical protein
VVPPIRQRFRFVLVGKGGIASNLMAQEQLQARLHAFFADPTSAALATMAPLGLLAASVSACLGPLVGPAASPHSTLERLAEQAMLDARSPVVREILAAPDDLTRATLLQQGLAADNDDVVALCVAVLSLAGPSIAAALPHSSQERLLSALGAGMRETKGPLALLAPRYLAALRDPMTDWQALRESLAADTSTVRQVMEATNIIDSHQRNSGTGKSSSQIMRATGDIRGSSQIHGTFAARPTAPLDDLVNDGEHLRELLAIRRRNLSFLERQEALAGINKPVSLYNEVRQEREAIAKLEARLAALDATSRPSSD